MIASCFSQLRFLVVESDASQTIVAKRLFAAFGVEPHFASSSDEALTLHAQDPFRVIVSNDLELCRQIRTASGRRAFLFFSTTVGDRGLRKAAAEAGADDYLTAPFDEDELSERLQVAQRILATEDRVIEQHLEEERNSRELEELNESLRLASLRFEDLFNGLPVACFTFDLEGGIHEWNRAAEEAFGIAAFDTLMRPVWEVLSQGDGAWSPDRCTRMFGGSGHEEFEWMFTGPSGTREFVCRFITIRGRNGIPTGAVCANVDVTAHKRAERILASEKANLVDANARLHDLASKDGLTGLWNRRSFLSDLEAAIAAYATTGKPFSLVLLDIDRFKHYNDTYGHPAGDEVLRRFARILNSAARSTEHPARYGGEEFAIVLHGTAAPKGLLAAERFRKAVEEGDWIERPVTCSLGIASVGVNGTTAEALIAAADAALYVSKQEGRNRCSHAVTVPEKISA